MYLDDVFLGYTNELNTTVDAVVRIVMHLLQVAEHLLISTKCLKQIQEATNADRLLVLTIA